MDIQDDIERATFIPYVNENAVFRPRRRPRVRPAPRAPRYVHLLEDYPDNYVNDRENIPPMPTSINPFEIYAQINMANAASMRDTNRAEECTTSRQASYSREESEDDDGFGFMTNSESDRAQSSNSDTNNLDESRENEAVGNTEQSENEEAVLKTCKLHRNAAIKGLIKNHLMSVKDLAVSSTKSSLNQHDAGGCPKTVVNSTGNQSSPQNPKGIAYVHFPNDPDIIMTSLQAFGIDESKHKDIDFTVPRLGKKTVLTPLDFLVYGFTDDCFNFVKKSPNSQ